MWTIYKTTGFESAHLLEGHPKCGKMHGHSYVLEVWITGKAMNPPYNFILDFHVIGDIAKKYDHSDVVIRQSAEELARDICTQILDASTKEQHPFQSVKVRVWETKSAYAEYSLES